MLHQENKKATLIALSLLLPLIVYHFGLLEGVKAGKLDRPEQVETKVVKTVTNTVEKERLTLQEKKEKVKQLLKQEQVPVQGAFSIINCESRWKQYATRVNKHGSLDRGLWQINNKYHPEVSNKEAFDLVSSTKHAIRIYKERGNNWSAWECSKQY